MAVQFHPQHAAYDDIRRQVVKAEEMGVDIVYNWDHFYPLYGDADGAHFECWTMLASWAEITEKVQIGPLVTCNSYRNPQLLADMARTVDHISGGRTILGIGSGWFERDYEEYGYEFGTAGWRLDNLARDLPIIKERLGKLNPGPVGELPIMIGGGGEKKTLRMVAEHADTWHYFWNLKDPDAFARKSQILDEWCAKVGRNPDTIRRSAGVEWSKTGPGPEFAHLDEITLGLNGPDYDLDPVQDWLDWRDE
ncbi:MAG: LLM class F420-dependent oxidoreductase [Acidimicrobiia bacterium]|nr:LLM class F420-dependent oxidoreductase [Acidimicrobiia bacterium]NNF10908.1 LLM class F420-dependent oxidoreductase [Acidimicrobiia bacterium]NNL71635.1 LLM class F420-dependent oxidoreductase [Acidimicrobiia bacterium]